VSIHECRRRVDAEFPQQGHQQDRLVLAVAESLAEDLIGWVRLMRVGTKLHAQIPHLVLHEVCRGVRPRWRPAGIGAPPAGDLVDRCRAMDLRVEQLRRPTRNRSPRVERADFDPRVGVEPAWFVCVGEIACDVARFPGIRRPRIGGRDSSNMLRGSGAPTRYDTTT
jgi:hypothetical protein